jgi:hypothetical protein
MCELRVTRREFLAEQDQLICSHSVNPGIYLLIHLSGYRNAYLLSKFKLCVAHEGFLCKKGTGNEIIRVIKTERKGDRSREEMKHIKLMRK